MKTNLILGKTVIFIIAIFITVQSFGQRERGDLFTTTTRSEIGFTTEQSNKLDRMIANPIYLDHFFVTVNKLSEIQENGSVLVNLPDKENVELFIGKDIEYINDDDFSFFADFDPCDDERMGYFHLIAKDGDIFGQINIEEEIYELQDFGEHKNVLFKINPSIYSGLECAVRSNPDETRGTEESNIEYRTNACNVNVLVLFTNAAELVGNPLNSANLFMQQTNQIMKNSEANVTFTLAGVEELVGFNEVTGGIDVLQDVNMTLNNLRNSIFTQQRRNFHQADLVVLLTDGNWTGQGFQIFGSSYLDQWGDPDFGFVLVDIDAAGGYFTFTHELAHDFGCKHDNDDRGAPGFVFDARGDDFYAPWYWPKHRKTIMTIVNEGDTRIMHFSNPDVEFKGKKTGEEDQRENEDQLSAQGCHVSTYRGINIPEPMNVSISGPKTGNSGSTYTWCVNVSNCPEVESIKWEYSLDGFTYYPLIPYDPFCYTGSLPESNSFRFRVTVTCESGQVKTTFFYVWIDDNRFPCDDYPLPLVSNTDDNEISELIKISPNPFNDNLTFELNSPVVSDIDYSLFDIFGRELLIGTIDNTSVNKRIKSINTENIPSGEYFIKFKFGKSTITKSVVKL